jgi:hypothetical protein
MSLRTARRYRPRAASDISAFLIVAETIHPGASARWPRRFHHRVFQSTAVE